MLESDVANHRSQDQEVEVESVAALTQQAELLPIAVDKRNLLRAAPFFNLALAGDCPALGCMLLEVNQHGHTVGRGVFRAALKLMRSEARVKIMSVADVEAVVSAK